jgi:proteasome assembly chaperone (PAC2) family protein
VSAVFNAEDLREKLIQAGLELTEYNGPVSIHTYILEAAKGREIEVISLWGHAPQYLQGKNIRVAHSVLERLIGLTEMEVDLSELARASEYFDQQINHLVEQDPKLQEVIKKLEEIYRQSPSASLFMKKEEEAKDDKVIYIQAFLKRQEEEDKRED